MPVITVHALQTLTGQNGPLGRGTLELEYWAGNAPFIAVNDADVVFPEPIVIPIRNGELTRPLDVAPTLGICCARIRIRSGITRHLILEHYVSIPILGPVDFGDLTVVDPATFQPTDTALAAWEAAIAEVAAMTAEIPALIGAEVTSQVAPEVQAAQTARTGAETARTGAETARTGAETARTGAETARDAALAGQFAGAAVAGTGVDVNTLTTPGVYRFGQTAATASINLPGNGSTPGVMFVIQSLGTVGAAIQQIYFPYATSGGGNRSSRVEYQRTLVGSSSWNPWRAYASVAFDNPLDRPGTRLAIWNEAAGGESSIALGTGAQLGTFDLDVVTVPGTYHQNTSSSATEARHYPPGSINQRSVVEVVAEASNGDVLQRVTPLTGATTRGVYQRRMSSGAWNAWWFIPTQRVDQAAGRAIYTYDDVNGRDQLIHGDTGWRDITALVANGWTATAVFLRRVGWLVEVIIRRLDGAAATANTFVQFPSGFTPSAYARVIPLTPDGVNNAGIAVGGAAQTGSRGLYYTGGGALSNGYSFNFTTTDSWPTSLPGAAMGGVPS